MKKLILLPAAVVGVLAISGAANATEHQIKMLNNGPQGMMAFDHPVIKAKVGDTVRFVPADLGHNAEIIDGMLPPGAVKVKGDMSKPLVVKLTKPGTYGFRCAPHFGFGMVAVVQVGDGAPNRVAAEAAASKTPPMARKRFAADFAQLK
jgi:pseudoazurin